MSKEKSKKNVRNIPVSFRLNEEESEKLRQCAVAEICKEIEDFILELQQTFTSLKGFDVAERIGNGV